MIIKVTGDGTVENADNPWSQLAHLSEIDISVEGVSGAANFFEAKSQALAHDNENEMEIKREREERKAEIEAKKQKREEFKNLRSNFQ